MIFITIIVMIIIMIINITIKGVYYKRKTIL